MGKCFQALPLGHLASRAAYKLLRRASPECASTVVNRQTPPRRRCTWVCGLGRRVHPRNLDRRHTRASKTPRDDPRPQPRGWTRCLLELCNPKVCPRHDIYEETPLSALGTASYPSSGPRRTRARPPGGLAVLGIGEVNPCGPVPRRFSKVVDAAPTRKPKCESALHHPRRRGSRRQQQTRRGAPTLDLRRGDASPPPRWPRALREIASEVPLAEAGEASNALWCRIPRVGKSEKRAARDEEVLDARRARDVRGGLRLGLQRHPLGLRLGLEWRGPCLAYRSIPNHRRVAAPRGA